MNCLTMHYFEQNEKVIFITQIQEIKKTLFFLVAQFYFESTSSSLDMLFIVFKI